MGLGYKCRKSGLLDELTQSGVLSDMQSLAHPSLGKDGLSDKQLSKRSNVPEGSLTPQNTLKSLGLGWRSGEKPQTGDTSDSRTVVCP